MSETLKRAAKAAGDCEFVVGYKLRDLVAHTFVIINHDAPSVALEQADRVIEKAASAAFEELSRDHPNLGVDLGSAFGGMWGLIVHDGDRAIPIAFSYEQAKEIAKRIDEALK